MCASSAVSAFQHIAVFGGADLTGGESLSYIDTREFFLKFNSDLRTIIDDASHNANQARYDDAKNSTVQRARQFVADALPLIAEYEEQYEMYEYYVNGYSAEEEELPQIDYSALEERYGAFDCGYDDAGERLFFTMDTGDENISENVLFEVTAPLHKTADEIASQLNSQFGKQIYTYYCYETNDSGEAAKLEPKVAASCRVYRAAPVSRLMMGLMKLSVREVTMPEKALPIMTPTAMSITLPRRAKALNSWMNLRI